MKFLGFASNFHDGFSVILDDRESKEDATLEDASALGSY